MHTHTGYRATHINTDNKPNNTHKYITNIHFKILLLKTMKKKKLTLYMYKYVQMPTQVLKQTHACAHTHT